MKDQTAKNLEILKWQDLTPIEKYFYIKQCFANIHGDFNLPLTIMNFGMLAGVFLKSYGFHNTWFLIPIGLVSVVVLIWLGHLKYKYKFASRELSIQNKFNPELMKIFDNSKKDEKTQFIDSVSMKEKFEKAENISEILQ